MADITQKLGFDAGQAISEVNKLAKSLNVANTALAQFKGSAGGAALANTTKGLKEAKEATNGLAVGWKTMARVVQTQLIVRGIDLIVTSLKDSVEQARLLGLAIEEVRTIDTEGRGAGQLADEILAVSDAIGKSPQDLAEGLYQTLSNQVVKAGEALEFTATAAKLATITSSETGDAVNALSSVMNSYGLEASEADRVSSSLFKTVEQGRLRLSEIANVIGRVLPLTAELGITWEETAASIATMTRTGVRADTAITQLRAVVTRLIKPTEDVSAIFHKWGVVDGKQAIAVFGGLGGVLKELEKETGGSSQEMADLLRNVRAITGVFGIMNDDGKTLASIMQEITTDTNASKVAWDQFSQSDAQNLTKSAQQFSNQLTRIGTQLVPMAAGFLDIINGFIEAESAGIKGILNLLDSSRKGAQDLKKGMDALAASNKEFKKSLTEGVDKQFDQIRNASVKYYAEANKMEFALATVREASIQEATASMTQSGKNLTDFYGDSIKSLEAFSKAAATGMLKVTESIAKGRRTVEDRALNYKLEKEKDTYRKINILREEEAKLAKKATALGAKVTSDPASLKLYEEAQQRVLDMVVRRIDLEKSGNTGRMRREEGERDFVAETLKMEKIKLRHIEDSASATDLVQKQTTKMIDGRARLLDLAKQDKKIREDGKVNKIESEQLKANVVERKKINEELSKGADILAHYGLQKDFRTTVEQLEAALNQAHKNWSLEVLLAKEAFEKEVLFLRVQLDPAGVKDGAAKLLGIQRTPGENEGTYLTRVDEGTETELKRIRDIQGDITLAKANINAISDAGVTAEKAATAEYRAQLKLAHERTVTAHTLAVTWATIKGTDEARATLNKKLTEETMAQNSGLISLNDKYGAYKQQILEGAAVSEGTLYTLAKETDELRKQGTISAELHSNYATMHQTLVQMNAARVTANKLESTIPASEEVAVLQAVVEAEQQRQAANKDTLQIAAELLTAQEASKAATDSTVGSTNELKDATTGVSTEAAGAAAGASDIGINALGSIGATNALAAAAAQVALNFERAARASASVGGGVNSQTVQNPFTQAEGGPITRGGDKYSALLSAGETVINSKSSRKWFSELNAMNQGSKPVFREQGGPVTNVGDVNVSVNGGDSSQQTVREIGIALRRQIQRGNIKLR